jgi:hypothetical protein
MCFHGLGHGILAYLDYNMPQAVELCKKTGTASHYNREYIECVGGTVMEITGGGFHNREIWEKQSAIYAPPDDPLAPCNADYMPKEARGQCYMYLTPRLWTAFGGNLGNPTETDFEKGFTLCKKVPDSNDRAECYGGFGKDFIVFVQQRDIRKIELMTDEQLLRVKTLCELARAPEGIRACVMSALYSLYWGGENDYHVSLRYCAVMTDSQLKDSCYQGLIGAAGFYERKLEVKQSLCADMPDAYASECRTRLIPTRS